MRENKFRWFEYVVWNGDSEIVNGVMKINVEGKTRSGKPKMKWIDGIEGSMKIAGVSVQEVRNRVL